MFIPFIYNQMFVWIKNDSQGCHTTENDLGLVFLFINQLKHFLISLRIHELTLELSTLFSLTLLRYIFCKVLLQNYLQKGFQNKSLMAEPDKGGCIVLYYGNGTSSSFLAHHLNRHDRTTQVYFKNILPRRVRIINI